MKNENIFFDKTTIVISVVCVFILVVTGTLFLKMENENHSTIIKSEESSVIKESIDESVSSISANGNEYDPDLYGLININTASEEELSLLTGIDKKKAAAIIKYRTTHKFTTIRDIIKVNGIGEKTFNAISDKICVE